MLIAQSVDENQAPEWCVMIRILIVTDRKALLDHLENPSARAEFPARAHIQYEAGISFEL